MDVTWAGMAPAIMGLLAAAIGWGAALYGHRNVRRHIAEKQRAAAEATPAE